ncbi:glycosyltransferase [Nocardioides zhouii]|uniref:Glycosyltransferase family 1 protein n=1 Tax=Nocardioides zhouii TaxID=1168729 RepID=A0A4Q2T3W8_9ACTN|nr:glycosyltransferase [Nocardioides zhouii]RYC11538.1 glycosyltransferase family 1 protein [Nocardioides zhouii]
MPVSGRVIHYYPRFLDHRSGVTESIASWAAIAATGGPTEVWVAGERDGAHRDAERLDELGIPLRRVSHVGRSSRTYLMKWWATNLRRGDILYVHEGWVPSNVLAVRHARRVGATVVAMPHGVYAPQIVDAGRDILGIRARLERHALRRVDAVHLFFPSEVAEVSAVAGAAVPAGVFSNPAPEIDASGAWVGDGDYFVWIGRFVVDHKGLDLLLRGWAELPAPRPRLVLAGPDYLGGRAEVEALVVQLGLGDSVTTRHSVSGPEKEDLMIHARGYVHSSRWDACSMVLLEFMTRGTPCLVNSTVHAAADYAAAAAALTFSDVQEFPQRIVELSSDDRLGERAAHHMRAEVSAEALRAPYLAWLESLRHSAR